MELRQLVYFESVARLGGFTRAAEALHVAQPAISAQIRQLESELGVPLFVRTTRRVSLTSAGEVFLARTRRVLAELEGAKADVGELAAVLRGRVSLGATEVLGPFNLAGALAAFHARHPGLALSLRTGLIGQLLASLDAGETDFVLGPIHSDLASRYRARPVVREPLVLATAPGHRFDRLGRVPLADTAGEAFVCLPPGSGLRAILDAAAAQAGFGPDVQFEASGPAGVRALVAVGLGVALAARCTTTPPGPPVSVHDLEPRLEPLSIGLIRRRDRQLSPAAQAGWRHLAASPDRSYAG
jgi:LysR family transcriptional regulator, transcription activator of glutamate synthase operon